ncbi:MAG TPA: hypothetical protein VFS20_19605 [Longimicrobium sp.]|nr:hypothetical protein [Longimicrobium sp.]
MKFPTRTARRSILALCCLLALGACRTWEDHSAPTPTAGRTLRAVRLTLVDGSEVVLKRAAISGDSIVGTAPQTKVQTAIALASVRKSEIRRIDPSSTFWTVFLGVVAAGLAFPYVALYSEST